MGLLSHALRRSQIILLLKPVAYSYVTPDGAYLSAKMVLN